MTVKELMDKCGNWCTVEVYNGRYEDYDRSVASEFFNPKASYAKRPVKEWRAVADSDCDVFIQVCI